MNSENARLLSAPFYVSQNRHYGIVLHLNDSQSIISITRRRRDKINADI